MSKLLNLHAENLRKFARFSALCAQNKFEFKKDYSTSGLLAKGQNASVNAKRYSSGIVTSSLGNVKVPNENLVEHVWKNYEKWGDKPAAVSIVYLKIKKTDCRYVCVRNT